MNRTSIWVGRRRARAKSTFWQILSLEAFQAIWDYVCRRFCIVDAENITKPVGGKTPRVSDLISLDACRSGRMHHLAANQPAERVRSGQSSFRRISRIYNFLSVCPSSYKSALNRHAAGRAALRHLVNNGRKAATKDLRTSGVIKCNANMKALDTQSLI